jgi:hypothetical protein
MKIKYPPNAIRKADKEIKETLQNIIDTKIGGTTVGGRKAPSRKLNKISGNLRNNIKPIIVVKNNELFIDVEVMEYYKWLDVGSSKIKNPWFLTEELVGSPGFISAIEVLMAKGIAFTLEKNLKVE